MKTKKTLCGIWLEPEIKALGNQIAKLERRSFSSLVDVMILDQAKQRGISFEGPKAKE